MFKATIAGVIAGLYQSEGVAALIVGDVSGDPQKGAQFKVLGRSFTVIDAFDHAPDKPDFPVPDGRIVTMIVTPDAELFDLSDELRGKTITIEGR